MTFVIETYLSSNVLRSVSCVFFTIKIGLDRSVPGRNSY